VELFEKRAINTAVNKAIRWYRYVDNTFVVWPHGKQELQEIPYRLNGIHQNISPTMGREPEVGMAQ
jgi:hypothetical protein